MIEEFTLDNVRCFKGQQTARIRPMTFLVGEHNTGKTTLLGCLYTASSIISPSSISMREYIPDFNCYPYDMGGFIDIVRKEPRQLKRFSLGITYDLQDIKMRYTFDFVQDEQYIEAAIDKIAIVYDDIGGIILRKNTKLDELVNKRRDIFRSFAIKSMDTESNTFHIDCGSDIFEEDTFPLIRAFLFNKKSGILSQEKKVKFGPLERNFLAFIHKLQNNIYSHDRPFLIQSIYNDYKIYERNALREYDPETERTNPDYSYLYYHLSSIHNTKHWKPVKERIDAFGAQSGMFESIHLKRLGYYKSDPIQILVTIRGKRHNLIDAGAGVGQIISIVTPALDPQRWHNIFTIQQPEMRIHPKAQVALANTFVQIVNERRDDLYLDKRFSGLLRKRFIIETHTSTMIDQARAAVKKGELAADDLSVVYFEPTDDAVTIHNITVNRKGNWEQTPPGFLDTIRHI